MISMEIGDIFKPKKKSNGNSKKYGWLPPENTPFEEYTEEPIQSSAPKKQLKTNVENVELASLIAEWNCFKYKMESYIALQKRK